MRADGLKKWYEGGGILEVLKPRSDAGAVL